MELNQVLALLEKMCKALDARQAAVKEAEAWYDGDHPIPLPPPGTAATVDREARIAFDAMAKLGITNFMPPVVDVPAASLHVEGFQFGASPISTDKEAWEIWQRNHLDADSDLANHGALKTGQTPVIVWADADGKATITVEDPSQCIVMYEAGSRRKRFAGLKRWKDEDGHLNATVYLADAIWKFRATQALGSQLYVAGQVSPWGRREVPGEVWPLPNPWGFVAMHELRANPSLKSSLYGGGTPEFIKQLPEQRKINLTTHNLLVTMEHQSFRQRWVTGWGAPTKPDGSPDTDALKRASAARVWVFEGDNDDEHGGGVRVGEFSQADFRPFIEVTTSFVKVIASTSGTPPYAFLLGDMINVAGDALARIEGIKLGKAKSHARFFGEDWSDVVRSALRVEGNAKAADMGASVVWGEFEQRTATEQANLAVQKKALGVPMQAVLATLPGVSQQQAERWVIDTAANEMRQAALRDPVPAAPAPAVP